MALQLTWTDNTMRVQQKYDSHLLERLAQVLPALSTFYNKLYSR